MIWHNSTYLWLLLLIPIIWGLYAFYRYKQAGKRSRFFDSRLLAMLRLNYWKAGDAVRFYCLLGALFFFIIGLAGPKIGTEIREVERSGVNMMVALDLSRSMNATDVPPNRLQKAKFEINRLINRLQGDRIGMIVFTGEAFIQSPFTLDYSAMRLFLDIVQTDQMPSSTTDFRAPILKAEEAFASISDEFSDAANILLFIADGENHGDEFEADLRRLTNKGVTTFAIGIGTAQGGRIPIFDNQGNQTGFHRGPDGSEVMTRLSTQTMRDIARIGGGNYYEINSGSDTIEPFFSRLDELERGAFSTQEFADYKNRYQLLLIIGLVLFVFGIVFPNFHLTGQRTQPFVSE
ncbi:MAG: VWA domain-containing protein [Balneolaceae bacterium]